MRRRRGANRNRRAGLFSYLIEKFVTVLAIGAAFLALLAGFLVGLLALPRASPMAFLLVWDAVVGVFLFFWIVELLAELRQSELLSLENFLLMVTALTYQFRGWLASLMVNRRRRRTVIAVTSLAFMLVGLAGNPFGFDGAGFRAYLVFTLAELAMAAYVYTRVLDWQGDILQRREQWILETVTAKSE